MHGRTTVAFIALSVALPALAGRPFATEDAGVADAGACEFEASGSHAAARGSTREHGFWLQTGCGLGRGLQVHLGAGASLAGETRRTGVATGGKWRVHGAGDDGAAWTLAWATAASRSHGRWQHDGHGLTLVHSWPGSAGTWHANLGHVRVPGSTSTAWALAHERALDAGIELGAELFGDDHGAPWAGLGGRWAVSPSLTLDAAFARQADSGRARALTLGVVLSW